MKVAVLASGSKGNATLVEMDGVRLLIDAGISARRLEAALADIGVPPETLDAVLLTHEHVDHLGGLRVFAHHWGKKIWTRAGTIHAAWRQLELSEDDFVTLNEARELHGLQLHSFRVPHDAADTAGFVICGSERFVLATDLGFVTSEVRQELENADVMVLESNHDLTMLQQGSYPLPLKKRILGSRGHLSNSAAAHTLTQLQQLPQHIFLAHLSEENNLPELAEKTVRTELAAAGRNLSGMQIHVTAQNRITML